MIDASEVRFETVFVHIDNDTGKETTFAVQRMADYLKQNPVEIFEAEIDHDFAEYCKTNRGIEKHRLDRITAAQLDEPLLFVEWPDGSHLMVDGHHRYVKASELKRRFFKLQMLPESVWRNFVVKTDWPSVPADVLLKSFSGIR